MPSRGVSPYITTITGLRIPRALWGDAAAGITRSLGRTERLFLLLNGRIEIHPAQKELRPCFPTLPC